MSATNSQTPTPAPLAARTGSASWWESGWERAWFRADSTEKSHRTWVGYRFSQLRVTLQRKSPNAARSATEGRP